MFKTITIKEEVYRKLLALKGEDESFSDLLERLAEQEIGSVGLLEKLRGTVTFENGEKRALLSVIHSKRSEKRSGA